jgi:hypothetical protein
MATEKIWLPLDNEGVLDGNQNNLIAIQHTPTITWQLKFFGCPKVHGGICFSKMILHAFLSPPLKIFNHHSTYPHRQMATKRGQGMCYHLGKENSSHTLPLGRLNFFDCHMIMGVC